jgi:hypothetical protein
MKVKLVAIHLDLLPGRRVVLLVPRLGGGLVECARTR